MKSGGRRPERGRNRSAIRTAGAKGAARSAAAASAPSIVLPSNAATHATAAACAIVSLAFYFATLCPTVSDGDSGELIAAAYRFGVLHPPGFPLYVLLAKLFTALPFGSVAWRVNLFSAVCDAGAVYLIGLAVARWTGSLACAALAAGAFAFSAWVWPFAVVAEVFALNNLFCAALLFLSVRAALAERGSADARRAMILAALTFGLGMANQHTLVFFGAPVALYLIVLERDTVRSPRTAIAISGAFAGGMLVYLVLPIAAATHPPIAWGDTSSLGGLITHVLRREYGTLQLASAASGGGGGSLAGLARFLTRFASTTFWIGPVLASAAALAALERGPRRGLVAFWSGTLALYVVSMSALSNLRLEVSLYATIIERFWEQAMVVFALLVGVGAFELTRRLGAAGRWIAWLLAIGFPALLAITGFAAANHREQRIFRDQALAILESLPPNAILMISSDEATNGVRYLQLVEGVRGDVHVIPTGLLTRPWYRSFAARRFPGVVLPPRAPGTVGDDPYTFREFVDANLARFPILIMNREPWLASLEGPYHAWPVGIVDRVLPRDSRPDLSAWVASAESSFARFDPARELRPNSGAYERYVSDNYWAQYERFARALATEAARHADDPEVNRLVVRALEPIANRAPSPSLTVLRNLGVGYQLLARSDPRAVEPMIRVWTRYLAIAPKDDPDLEKIRTLIVRARATMH